MIQLGANEFQGVKALQILAAQVGVSRFRLKLFLNKLEIMDDKIFDSEPVELLIVMDFCPADAEEQQKMLLAITNNDLVSLEEILQRGYDPNMTV